MKKDTIYSQIGHKISVKMFEQNFSGEQADRPVRKPNNLPFWGNEKTMNLNPLILTNIQASQYFKVNLYQLKTYHEVIDEIYYQVSHLEPWEKGSRKTSGQTGMCGGVRGVGAGGIVSTAFCILYKLYTLKLTRKQLQGLINHSDSPYIRGIGFMYIRYTQPPADLWEWLEPYLDDDQAIDVRAGGGQSTTVGTMCRHMLTKLEWHSTLFPRIPVPIQKDLEKKLSERAASRPVVAAREEPREETRENRHADSRQRNRSPERERYDRDRHSRNGDRENRHRDRRDRNRDDDRDSYRDRRDRRRHDHHDRHRTHDYAEELRRERDRVRFRRSRSKSFTRENRRRR